MSVEAALRIQAKLALADREGYPQAWYSYIDRADVAAVTGAVLEGIYVTGTGQVLHNVHPPEACAADDRTCVIHKPSDHHMRDWPTNWRDGGPFDIKPPHFERMCEHGIGHPDPDSLAYLEAIGEEGCGVHGCDGCCRPRPELQEDELAILPDGTTVGATSSGHLVARRHLPEFASPEEVHPPRDRGCSCGAPVGGLHASHCMREMGW